MCIWVDYSRKVRSFVHQVGCANIHDKPEENIAELRLFYSTTIGYFAKLQDQYLKKQLEVKKLRHLITALEFRHIVENLTPPRQPGTHWSNSAYGPRWEKFWEEALEHEYAQFGTQNQWASDHPLKNILAARNPKRGSVDNTGARKINKEGKNGQVYWTGKHLHGTLSDEIHHFRQGFMVEEDDGWTKLVTDVLRTLQPKNFKDGEVDWVAERNRYLVPGTQHTPP